jgi:hypothetical protein
MNSFGVKVHIGHAHKAAILVQKVQKVQNETPKVQRIKRQRDDQSVVETTRRPARRSRYLLVLSVTIFY